MSNKAEINRLKLLITEDIWEVLKEHKAIIAGGAITSIFTNQPINDIDVYFRSEEDLHRVILEAWGYSRCPMLGSHDLTVNSVTKRSVLTMSKDTGQHIQLMSFKYFEDAHKIFDSYDFTVCMGAFDMVNEEFVFHEDFFKHNSQRYLKFNKGTDFPLMSLLRTIKYKEKGYLLSQIELVKIMMACMSLKINDWESLENHLSGMYGAEVTAIFDKSKDFSFDQAIESLHKVNGQIIHKKEYNGSDSFEDPYDVICLTTQAKIPPAREVKFKKGFWYKCTGANFISHYDNKTEYRLGETLLAKDHPHGIYAHKNPDKPNFNEKYHWVEMKLLNGEVEQMNGQVKLKGDIIVTDTFIRADSDAKQYFIEKYEGALNE